MLFTCFKKPKNIDDYFDLRKEALRHNTRAYELIKSKSELKEVEKELEIETQLNNKASGKIFKFFNTSKPENCLNVSCLYAKEAIDLLDDKIIKINKKKIDRLTVEVSEYNSFPSTIEPLEEHIKELGLEYEVMEEKIEIKFNK